MEDESKQISRWLSTEGYPLEYECRHVLTSHGFQVSHSEYYFDEQSQQLRELDIRGQLNRIATRLPGVIATLMLIVECKAASKPWVVLDSIRDGMRWWAVGPESVARSAVINTALAMYEANHEEACWLFELPSHDGYSVIEAFRKGSATDPAYSAVQSVVDATLASSGMNLGNAIGVRLTVPVIVIASHLYHLWYEEDGTEVLERCPWRRVLFRGKDPDEPIAVDIVQRDSFGDYVSHAKASALELFPAMVAAFRARAQGDDDTAPSQPAEDEPLVEGMPFIYMPLPRQLQNPQG